MLPLDVNYYKLMFNHSGYKNTTQNGANGLLLKLIIKIKRIIIVQKFSPYIIIYNL